MIKRENNCRSSKNSTFVRQSLQDVKEYHDNVGVQNDGAEHVVVDLDLVAFASHYELRIDDQVYAVDQNSNTDVEGVHLTVREHKEEDQAEHHRHGNAKDQDGAPENEVERRAPGEESQRDYNDRGHKHRLHDD